LQWIFGVKENVVRNKDPRNNEYWKELSEDTLNTFSTLGTLGFKVRDPNFLGTWSNTLAMPPICKIIYWHLLSCINASTGYLQLLRRNDVWKQLSMVWKWRHWSIPWYLYCTWTCVMLFEHVLQAFDVPAEEVLGQSSNVRITKMCMKDSVVFLYH
jgi:hypothetical protein